MKRDAFGNEIPSKSWWPSRRATSENLEPVPVGAPEPTRTAVPFWRRVWGWGRWVVLVVIAINLITGLFGGDDGVNAIEVGDCFNLDDTEFVEGFDRIDCSEDHEYELYLKLQISGFGQEYPGSDALFRSLSGSCRAEFAGYVGVEFETSVYWVFTIVPDGTSWESGDRTGLCSVYLGDNQGNLLISDGSARNIGV